MSDPTTVPELLALWDEQAEYNLSQSRKYRTNCNKDQRGLLLGRYAALQECARQLRLIHGDDTG